MIGKGRDLPKTMAVGIFKIVFNIQCDLIVWFGLFPE